MNSTSVVDITHLLKYNLLNSSIISKVEHITSQWTQLSHDSGKHITNEHKRQTLKIPHSPRWHKGQKQNVYVIEFHLRTIHFVTKTYYTRYPKFNAFTDSRKEVMTLNCIILLLTPEPHMLYLSLLHPQSQYIKSAQNLCSTHLIIPSMQNQRRAR